MTNFWQNMRRAYKKRGKQLLWIMRIEIGKKGGIHIHIIINKIRGEPATSELIQRYWKKHGYVNFTPLYEDGDFRRLANYITKPLPDEKNGWIRAVIAIHTGGEKRMFHIFMFKKSGHKRTGTKKVLQMDGQKNHKKWTRADTGILHRSGKRGVRS